MTLALIGVAADHEREMSGSLISRGYGDGCANREELFNKIDVQLLCDYVYHITTQHMDEKKRVEFDSLLNECGDKTAGHSQQEMLDKLLADPMAEVEFV